MRQISIEAKEVILKKVLNRGCESIESIARSNGVSKSALTQWLKQYREFGKLLSGSKLITASKGPDGAERLTHLINTASLDEESLGAYCRKHGLYSHQLKQWKDFFMSVDEAKKSSKEKGQLKSLKLENKQLKQELRRKEKALAEASALLILKKKASLIWGEVVED